jgi:hypothetical protein
MTTEIKTGPVTDQEAAEWMNNLSNEDKQELRRQALLKRATDLSQPKAEPNLGNLSDAQFAAYKRSLGIGS